MIIIKACYYFYQLGQAGELVKAAAEQFRLDEATKIVLEDVLNDFERKLKIQQNH